MKEYRIADYKVSMMPLMVWRQHGASYEHNQLHRHNCLEMMYIVMGAGICYINGKPYPASRGDLFIMSGKDTHEFVMEREFYFYNIMLSPDIFNAEELSVLRNFPDFAQWLDNIPGGDKKYTFMPPTCDDLENKIETSAAEFRIRGNGFELNGRAAFVLFLISALRQISNAHLKNNDTSLDSAISRTINYINLHAAEPLTLRHLAEEAHVAPSTLSRAFKKSTGDTIFDYIGKVRIGRAQFELEHTGKSISQIAGDLGYYDSSYFSNVFRRHAGMSPREYRNRYRAR